MNKQTGSMLERQVLACLIFDYDLFYKAQELLRPFMFTDEREAIAKVIWQMQHDGKMYDIAVLADQVEHETKGEVKSLQVIELAETFTDANLLDDYINRLSASYKTRKGYEILQTAQNEVIAGESYEAAINTLISEHEQLINLTDSGDDTENTYLDTIEQISDTETYVQVPSLSNQLNDKGGYKKSGYIVIMGRPGMGKTTLGLMEMLHQARNSYQCAFWSFEMTKHEVIRILGCLEAGINPDDFFKARDNEQMRAKIIAGINRCYEYGIKVFDLSSKGVTNKVEDLISKAAAINHKEGLDCVYIDYLTLMRTYNPGGTKNETVENISAQIVAAKIKLGITFYVLAQLNRGVEHRGGSKRPELHDLRDSGSIEQDADIVVAPYRAEYYDILEDAEGFSTIGMTELLLLKYRGNGKMKNTSVKLYRDANTGWLHDEKPNEFEKPQIIDMNIKPQKRNDDDDIPF